MPEPAAVHVTVSGRVQGVYYRAFVSGHARRLGLTGWVRNRPNGAVEVMAEGEKRALEELVSNLWEGPPAARVNQVEAQWLEPTGDFGGFSVRH